MKEKTVLVGMSGGVDSSVAALLLKKQGFRVIGAFMKNYSDTKNKLTGECNWIEDRAMAQKIAAVLKIPFITLDFENEYKKHVISPMFDSYKQGLTPNPDIACNTIIKFPLLWKEARKHHVDYIATGHYAQIKKTSKGYALLQGKDKTKDQSYFLSELTQKDLEHVLFPLGSLTKNQVRTIAKKNKFPNADRQGSRGICFVGNVPMKSFLDQRLKSKSGNVLDEKNNVIGTHRGAHYYTIGERAGEKIGISLKKGNLSQTKFFIAKKNVKTNTLIALPENHPLLKKSIIKLKKLHWINPQDKKTSINGQLRIRHLGNLIPATLTTKNKTIKIKSPISGVAPGQFAVFYQDQKLVCSGQII